MKNNFLETIRQAFTKGDFNREINIRKALLYENFITSPDAIQNYLQNHSSWKNLDPLSPAPGNSTTNGKPLPFVDFDNHGSTITSITPVLRKRIMLAGPYPKSP